MTGNGVPDASETIPFDEDSGPNAGSTPERHFTWILPDRVIGMGRPSSADLAALTASGVNHVISLTLRPLPRDLLSENGIAAHHIPLADMAVPSPQEISSFVETLSSLLEEGEKVAVHCGAGLGRTGTMLACYLVSTGMCPEEAMTEVRTHRRGSIESRAQEQAVRDYERHLRG